MTTDALFWVLQFKNRYQTMHPSAHLVSFLPEIVAWVVSFTFMAPKRRLSMAEPNARWICSNHFSMNLRPFATWAWQCLLLPRWATCSGLGLCNTRLILTISFQARMGVAHICTGMTSYLRFCHYRFLVVTLCTGMPIMTHLKSGSNRLTERLVQPSKIFVWEP